MNWTTEEVKLIVEDYFKMLQSELGRKPYNKTLHRKELYPLLNGRSEGSIEFKHQNISAALINMGLPYINGYKPRFNYQKELIEKEISSYIKKHLFFLEEQFESFSSEVLSSISLNTVQYETLIEDAPTPHPIVEKDPLFKPIKVNYLEKEQNNRKLGEEGEKLVIEYERWRLINAGKSSFADKIEWTSKNIGDGVGYDILSKNINGTDRFIEVKTTKLAKETPIFLSKNEVSFASRKPNSFFLYRVFNFDRKPQIFIQQGKYETFCNLIPQSYKGFF